MIRVLAIALVVVLAVAGVQSWRLSLAVTRAETAEATAASYAAAAQVRARQDAELTRLRDQASQIDTYLSTQEGGDAPLSPYLRDAAGKIWP